MLVLVELLPEEVVVLPNGGLVMTLSFGLGGAVEVALELLVLVTTRLAAVLCFFKISMNRLAESDSSYRSTSFPLELKIRMEGSNLILWICL